MLKMKTNMKKKTMEECVWVELCVCFSGLFMMVDDVIR